MAQTFPGLQQQGQMSFSGRTNHVQSQNTHQQIPSYATIPNAQATVTYNNNGQNFDQITDEEATMLGDYNLNE